MCVQSKPIQYTSMKFPVILKLGLLQIPSSSPLVQILQEISYVLAEDRGSRGRKHVGLSIIIKCHQVYKKISNQLKFLYPFGKH